MKQRNLLIIMLLLFLVSFFISIYNYKFLNLNWYFTNDPISNTIWLPTTVSSNFKVKNYLYLNELYFYSINKENTLFRFGFENNEERFIDIPSELFNEKTIYTLVKNSNQFFSENQTFKDMIDAMNSNNIYKVNLVLELSEDRNDYKNIKQIILYEE